MKVKWSDFAKGLKSPGPARLEKSLEVLEGLKRGQLEESFHHRVGKARGEKRVEWQPNAEQKVVLGRLKALLSRENQQPSERAKAKLRLFRGKVPKDFKPEKWWADARLDYLRKRLVELNPEKGPPISSYRLKSELGISHGFARSLISPNSRVRGPMKRPRKKLG